MLKLRGLYHYFPMLDKISTDRVLNWLDKRWDPTLSENELGNRLLYPQTIPVTTRDLAFDLAMLREIAIIQPQRYYNPNFHRMTVPEDLLERFPDIVQITWALIDAFGPLGLTTVYLRSERLGVMAIGTVFKPEVVSNSGTVSLTVDNVKYQLKIGTLAVIPIANHRTNIRIISTSLSFLGKSNSNAQVVGGMLGLLVDLRQPLKKPV